MAIVLEEIRDLAELTAIRLELGSYVVRGPRENIMEVESRVAWWTIAGQLHHDGYEMVTPAEYAKENRLTEEQVIGRIEKEGSLFAIYFEGHDETVVLVPLEERRPPGHFDVPED